MPKTSFYRKRGVSQTFISDLNQIEQTIDTLKDEAEAAALDSEQAASSVETAATQAQSSADAAQTYAASAALKASEALNSEAAAAQSAADALASKNSAALSEVTVLTVEANVGSAETNAAASELAAAASATAAAASETAAGLSEAAAAASELAAASSTTAASTSEVNAATSASSAATSAASASTSETNSAASAAAALASQTAAATSEANAASSATAAASSASSAASAQSAAEAARDQTLASFDSFDDRYLGPKASDPTLDNDGNALLDGALYWNTTTEQMKIYAGASTGWVNAYGDLTDTLLKVNNLSDLPSAATARANLGLGTSATIDVGTAANQIVQLDGSAKLPALDGSQLTGIVSIPSGLIAMWSGTIATIPSGWALCNGLNGTPDLTGRFVIHADADTLGAFNVGATGGAYTVTLTEAELPSHTHLVDGNTSSAGNHSHNGTTANNGAHNHNTNNAGNHNHNVSNNGGHNHGVLAAADNNGTNVTYSIRANSRCVRGFGGHNLSANTNVAYINANPTSNNINTTNHSAFLQNTGAHNHNLGNTGAHTHNISNTGNHSHNFSTSNTGAHTHQVYFTSGATGGGATHENMPPYYALAYIMKL